MDKELSAKSALNGKKAGKKAKGPAAGLTVKRFFTTPGVDPADELAWEYRTAGISGEDGRSSSSRRTSRCPRPGRCWRRTSWRRSTSGARPGTPERESSVRKLVARVVDTLTRWGQEGGYFATEADRGHVPRGADAPAAAPEGGLQLARLVQRGRGGAPAVLRVLHQLRGGLDGVHPHAGQDGGHALQVRLGHRQQPVHPALQHASCSPAAVRPRARCPS